MTVTTPAARMWMRTHSIDTATHGFYPSLNSMAGATYPTANTAIYVPVVVRSRVVIRKLWLSSSSGATANIDLGVYDAAGTRLVSAGSTAKVADTEQVVDVTDTTIGPGLYYMAVNCSNTTDSIVVSSSNVPFLAGLGVLTEAVGSVTLPATATWAVDQTLTKYPLIGMLLGTVVS